jgi:formylglycine-generating enzyme required for sulfatase activity
VTVKQFQAFIEAGGYSAESPWWIAADGSLAWWQKHRQPQELTVKLAVGTLPRTLVCWYEAMAFCRWLEMQAVNEGWQVRLPSEAEWEAISRAGERAAETDGLPRPLPWPWPDDEDAGNLERRPLRINMYGSGIDGPSVVGAFPDGVIGGVQDLLGNVWEWCLDGLRNYEAGAVENPFAPLGPGSDRALRGGCFWGGAGFCRCAYRLADPPDIRNADLGFRVVRLSRQAGPPGAGGSGAELAGGRAGVPAGGEGPAGSKRSGSVG